MILDFVIEKLSEGKFLVNNENLILNSAKNIEMKWILDQTIDKILIINKNKIVVK